MDASIVVAAYGPDGVTRAAVRAAKELSNDVVVFAGLAVGAGAARRSAWIAGRTADGCGSAALADALRALPPGPVLFVHDDVLVTRDALRALVRAWNDGGGYVVPWSNDIGMDHFCGPLPEVRRAADAVAQRAAAMSGPPPEARTVRPSCILAGRDDLLALVGSHPADPRLRLDVVDLHVRIAPGSVVAHDSTCARRHAAPPAGRPLLVAAMIVRDEEEMLPACLESLRGLVDDIVVCDTGSTDRTVELALAAGATVIHRAWRDDFGWARSQALDAAAHGAWVLTVDADDRIVCDDPDAVRAILATYAGEYEAFGVVVENTDDDGRVVSEFDSPRIFRGGRFRYEGAVHEVLCTHERERPFAPRLEAIRLLHVGYHQDVVSDRGKQDRNLTLARELYERAPTVKHAIEYARSMNFAGGDPAEAAAVMRRILAQIPATEPRVVSYVRTLLATNLLTMGEAEEACDHARIAIETVPADDLAAQAFAVAALRLGRPDAVVEMEAGRRARPSLRPIYSSDVAGDQVRSLHAAALAATGDLAHARRVAAALLETRPDRFGAWEHLVSAHASVPASEAAETLGPLVALDTTGEAVRWAAGRLRPAAVAALCAAACEEGAGAQTVFVGLTAALVTQDRDAFAAIARYAGRLDADVLAAIASRAVELGRGELAELLPAGVR